MIFKFIITIHSIEWLVTYLIYIGYLLTEIISVILYKSFFPYTGILVIPTASLKGKLTEFIPVLVNSIVLTIYTNVVLTWY